MAPKHLLISLEELKRLVRYEPETGLFYSRVTTCSRRRKGQRLGGLSSRGYLKFTLKGRSYTASRVAWYYMTGRDPKRHIDHINRVKTDNRFANLRLATNAENCRNRKLSKRNTSGFTGVTWDRDAEKWRASIRVDGKLLSFGRFSDINDAMAARRAAELEYFGSYSPL